MSKNKQAIYKADILVKSLKWNISIFHNDIREYFNVDIVINTAKYTTTYDNDNAINPITDKYTKTMLCVSLLTIEQYKILHYSWNKK